MITRLDRGAPHRAFSILFLLLALCIIGILTARQLSEFLERDRTGISEVRRAGAAACQVNRNVLVTTINIWRMSHPDVPVTIEYMRRTGQNVPSCPEGGVYVIGVDGTIHCSIHAPPPQPEGAQPPLFAPDSPGGPGSGEAPPRPAQAPAVHEGANPFNP